MNVAAIALWALKNWKTIAIVAGLITLVTCTAVFVARYEGLKKDRETLHVIQASEVRLAQKYACGKDPLETCLETRIATAEKARADVLETAAKNTAEARSELALKNSMVEAQARTIESFIDQAPKTDDGPVPKVLSETWKRLRAQEGAK